MELCIYVANHEQLLRQGGGAKIWTARDDELVDSHPIVVNERQEQARDKTVAETLAGWKDAQRR